MWNAAGIGLALADASEYGFDAAAGAHDWMLLKGKRDAFVARLNAIYAANLVRKGVEYLRGAARFVDAHTVEVAGRRVTAAHVVIASDSSWKWAVSEITFNDVWKGYAEDRRLAQPPRWRGRRACASAR